MNLVKNGPMFFLIGGVVLLACGALQLLSRKRELKGASLSFLATPFGFKIALFFAVGLLAILMGVGVIPVGPQRPPVQSH